MQFPADTLSPQLQIEIQSMLSHIQIVQVVVNGLCDFIAQCILVRNTTHAYNHSSCNYTIIHYYSPKFSQKKIYRCWIVWGKNIRVVIIPSFLAITFIGQSIAIYLSFDTNIYWNRFFKKFLLPSYLASDRRRKNMETRQTLHSSLGIRDNYNGFSSILGR